MTARGLGMIRPFARMRLRHKLTLFLAMAALLPVMVASWVAVGVILDSLDRSLRDETEKQLQVGLSLVLRIIGRQGQEATRLARNPELVADMQLADAETRAERLREVLARESEHLPAVSIQIFDKDGPMLIERIPGNQAARFDGLAVEPGSELVLAGLAYKNLITIVPVRDVLVVRAIAPIHDESYRLHGAVVLSVPLDGSFADRIKSDLGTDVLIFAGLGASVRPALSTFRDHTGANLARITMRPEIARQLEEGHTVLTTRDIAGRRYTVGYEPLVNMAGERVGAFGVAVDRESLLIAKSTATQSVALGVAAAFAMALILGGLLARRLTRPIARLHRGALAVAQGDLNYDIAVTESDEIGDLASAFSYMTRTLKENQERLAARMREIVALHDAGRAVSSVIDLDQVLRKIVDSVARVLDVRLCALWVVEPEASALDRPGTVVLRVPAERVPDSMPDSTPGSVPESMQDGVPRRIFDVEGAPDSVADSVADAGGAALTTVVLRLGAARFKATGRAMTMHGEAIEEQAEPLSAIAAEVAAGRKMLRIDRVAEDSVHRQPALAAGVTGSLMATPLERKGNVVGVIVVGRTRESGPFSEAHASLLATFADQAATAVENARLYEEVRAFNEELEAKVRLRTAELTRMNAELGRTLSELREAQSQLVLSERMAGLGLLVAGVAHEINSPSAAIRGSVDALRENVARLIAHAERLQLLPLAQEQRVALLDYVAELGPVLAARPMDSAVTVRRAARELAQGLRDSGIPGELARIAARRLTEIGAGPEVVARLMEIIGYPGSQTPASRPERSEASSDARNQASKPGIEPGQDLASGSEAEIDRVRTATGYFCEYVFLHRNALTIGNAIGRIQRIVGALKTYSHLDQAASLVEADLHDGIENTLVILDYVLRGITVVRKYGPLPRVPVYVDELNQVWTNLIHNAAQALEGRGRIVIETGSEEHGAWVRVIDDGPGIPGDILPRIFEPFFTTKPKGEGSGLGLGIVRQIVDKHRGRVTCTSEPGSTCFEVWLPRAHPRDAVPRPSTGEVVS